MGFEIRKFYYEDPLIQRERVNYELRRKQWIFSFLTFCHRVKTIVTYRNDVAEIDRVDFIFWCSDETQWKNQLPVIRMLTNLRYKVGLISNKKRILEIKTTFKILKGYLNTDHMLVAEFLVKKFSKTVRGIVAKNIELKWVILGNDLRWDDRLTARFFQHHKIRTAVINHGLNLMAEKLPFIIADVHFAWSEDEKQRITKSGHSGVKVVVSGSPALDEIIYGNEEDDEKAIDDFIETNVGANKRILLITFSGPGGMISAENHALNLKYLLSQAVGLKKLGFVGVIKLHPKDHVKYYSELIHSPVFKLIPPAAKMINKSIYPWIRKAFALLSGPSASMIDAMLLDKPAIYCDVKEEGTRVEFVSQSIVEVANESRPLVSILSDYIEQRKTLEENLGKQRRFLSVIYCNPDGKAAERIVDHLLKH